ncbi:MAG: GIY-YIG nuclease family protein [Sphingobacteriales bacterium]|nr:MAG: GIY-YIG nuclease family protein [Sphingobacteriales bacterium]
MYTVYAICSEVDARIYVGFTDNIERRLLEHNCDKTKSTKAYKPSKLIYTEQVVERQEARNREVFLKGGSGKEFLKLVRDKMDSKFNG